MPDTAEVVTPVGPLRKFTDSGIQGAIDKALATLPEDTKGAVVAYANQDGASLATFAKLGGGWSFVGVLEKPFKGKLAAEAAVRFSW